jgi:putative ABC transport system permease protein
MIARADTAAGSLTRLAVLLARQWWQQLAALAAACAVVAATIAGAVCVGRAMEAGLRDLAVGRLGRIEAAVVGERFFTTDLADRLHASLARGRPAAVVPAIVMPVTVTAGGSTAGATLLACNDPAGLGFDPSPPPLTASGILVNAPLAATLGLSPGDAVVLRLPRRSGVPSDSPLGRRSDNSDGKRLKVAGLLPPRGIGSFSLRPAQATGPLVVVSLELAHTILRRGSVANVILAAGQPTAADAEGWLRDSLTPTLLDFGLTLAPATSQPPSLRLTSDRLILPPAVDQVAAGLFVPRGGQPTLAFLANALTPLDGSKPSAASVPYSTLLGIATTTLPVGDLVDDSGQLLPIPADDEIVINRWMADDLAAQGRPVTAGDMIRLSYFEPETIHGEVVETTADVRIAGIAAMRGAAVARELVPDVEGITDEESIADWDPPFPFDASRVRSVPPHDQDDRYWKTYRATPKAFVSLATARRLAGSRFGGTTAWLLPAQPAIDRDPLAAQLAAALTPHPPGLRVVPVRADALKAARGSTPFGSLFLALSSFVIGAGLLLEGLLFALLVAARRRDLGILAAIGFGPSRVALVLLAIGGLAATAGVVAGTLLGPVWARGLLAWLAATWMADVEAGAGAAFTGGPNALATGTLLGAGGAALLVSLATLAVAAWRAATIPPLRLLQGGEFLGAQPRQAEWITKTVALAGLTLAGGAAAAGRVASASGAIGLFFTAGFGGLVGLLALVRLWLTQSAGGVLSPDQTALRSLGQLALRNLRFAPARAFSIAAIVAAASFLIVAVSSFAQRPPTDPLARSAPTGGWTDVVSFGTATNVDPTSPQTRGTLGLTAAQESLLDDCTIVRLRTSDGDDASCTNLYATLRPMVVGVGPDFIARGGFSFVVHATLPPSETNPWRLLDANLSPGEIPVILDQATAQWGLKVGGVGSRFTLPDDRGDPVACRIVGLLAAGILQGRVIVSEHDFERIFPDRSGYGMALVDAGRVAAERRNELGPTLTMAWADAGVSLTPATRRLASLQAVQNTFLAGFQVLGTLGLLLGTAGVAAVQLQGVFERIGPLAALRSVGFTLPRVRWMLVLETLLTVLAGLTAGMAAACLAVAPALARGEARLPLTWIALTAGVTFAAASLAAALAASRASIPTRPP